MRYIRTDFIVALFLSFLLTILLFWQFFINGLHPFPGNYNLAWYQPWKTDYTKGQTITLKHKPVADDTFRYLYPFKTLGIEIAKKGELPLWNPYNGAGMPLLATYQWGFFNPFNILFFYLKQEIAWSIYIIIQAFILSIFMYCYCRKISMSVKSAIFSTAIFTFSGFVVARLIFSNLIFPLTILPLILYLIEDYINNQKSKKILFLPLVVAFMLFSGHPHIMVYTIIISTAYLIHRIITTEKLKLNKNTSFLFLGILALIGTGIASIQILPTIELLKSSNMNPNSSAFIFERFLLPPSHLISILIPNYFGNQSTYNYWGFGDYIETVAAIGIIPSFFAYLALFARNTPQRNHILFFLGVLAISVLATLNWFLPKLIATLPIPIISTSPPSRIFVITSFSIAILAGFGFDRWIYYKINLKRLVFQTIPFLTAILLIVVITFFLYKLKIPCNNAFIQNCRLIAVRNTFLEFSSFIISLLFLFLYIKIERQKIKRCIPFCIILIILLLGAYNSYKFLPFSQKETILPMHSLIKTIKDKTSQERILGLGEANIKTNFATHFRFFDPNYYDPLYNRRYGELVAFSNNRTTSTPLSRSDIEITTDYDISKEKQARRNRLLNLLGVRYLILKKSEDPIKNDKNIVWQDDKWYFLENKEVLPRVFLADSFEILRNKEDILKRLFDSSFNPKEAVILEEKINTLINKDKRAGDYTKIVRYQENTIEIKTKSENNKLLVLSDNHYPGWKAYINGVETKIYRADYTFRAVEIPKGQHTVVFSYQPQSLEIGKRISLFSLFLLVIIYLYWITRQKK